MTNINLTNGVSYGALVTVEDTTPFEIQFCSNDKPVDYKMAVIMDNATFTEDNGVYEVTPTGAGVVTIIAQRAVEITLE